MPDFIYRVQPIIPIERDFFTLFTVGFDLDYRFALKSRRTKMPEKALKRFNESGDEIIKKFKLKNLVAFFLTILLGIVGFSTIVLLLETHAI